MIAWTYAFVDRPMDRFTAGARFWTAVTGTRLSARRGAGGEFATLLPAGGDACVKLQGVPDAGGAHLDLSVADVPAAVRAARDLGATTVAPYADWAVLRTPGGQLFCVVPWHDEKVRPAVVAAPDGTGSRLDQVCLDVGPSRYDAEVDFWKALTGWEFHRGSRPEFGVLTPPEGLPIRILLQRLDDERPTSAHVDLACEDVEATRNRHEEFGARVVARFPHWIVMSDPAGGVYCLTMRDPRTGRLTR